MKRVLLLDLVGLTPRLIGEETPNLRGLAGRGACAPMSAVLPAVTCSAQATLLTGLWPDEHGAVGNGWMDPATRDVALWRQANQLVSGEKVYEAAKALGPDRSTAKLFWWWNMGAPVDRAITPRPFYNADGGKVFAVYSWPKEFAVDLEAAHGKFPFHGFWGPLAGLSSSRWIADVTMRTLERHRPALTLAYLPHLDYDFQRHGPDDPRSRRALRELDELVGELVACADRLDVATVAVSEYGILPADRPVHVNRALREAGLLEVRESPTGELLDVFASRAFALSDHQVAHVYTRTDADAAAAAEVVRALPGVERVYDGPERAEAHLDHPRAGRLVAVAEPRAWFTYYYWLDDALAPEFARTIDIHRKPGYDPCEMFVDPALRLPKLRVAWRLAQKKLGMRYLLDVIPLAPELVKGSHGRLPDDPRDGPVFLCSKPFGECGPEPEDGVVDMRSVKERVLQLLR